MSVFQHIGDGAETVEKLSGSFRPDTGDPGDIVCAVTDHGKVINDGFGSDAEFFLCLRDPPFGKTFSRLIGNQHFDPAVDDL